MKVLNRKKKFESCSEYINDEDKLNISQGLYFIRYTGDNEEHGFVKIIKL